MSESFPSLNIIYGSGRNSSFVIQGTHHVGFSYFSKDKSPELQCHQEQDKQQLRPSLIISINYLDLAQAYATHEFQVQSKFLYQNSRIQNSGEFKAENQILERNYDRATIHHFHCKRLSLELIYLTPKNQTHSFILFFIFEITPYIGDTPPPSQMLSQSFLRSLSSFQKLFSSCSGCSSGSEECTSDGWFYF